MQTTSRDSRWRRLVAAHRGKLLGIGLLAVFMTGFAAAWALFANGDDTGQAPPESSGVTLVADGPSQFTCSMHPQIRQPRPGKCPVCAMDLVPVPKSSGGMRTLVLSPQAKALINVQTEPVERRYVTNRIQMSGKVDYDETKLENITAWVPGRLDRLFVDYTGVQVKKGDHMVYIYSEELYSAQEELIQALKYNANRTTTSSLPFKPIDLAQSAREKLRLLGLTPEQIKEIEQRKTPSDHMTINSPVGGIVIQKHRQQGDRVRTGDRIYTIADLTQVWVHLDAYESDLPWIKYGQQVTITTEAYPGEQFKGRLVFEQPTLHEATRTVKVRINVPNLHGKLKPGMFVHGLLESQVAAGGRVMDPELVGKWISPMHPEIVKDAPGNCDVCGMPLVRAETLGFVAADMDGQSRPLVVPYSAAMRTGRRAVVYVQLPRMHSGVETAFQGVATATKEGNVKKVREASEALANVLDKPYDQPGTGYARKLWNKFADRLSEQALAGQRAATLKDAQRVVGTLESLMNAARELFAPPEQPTFEGREIVLGPRAGDHYLVRHGLEEGELVVTQGNFKIDAEVQIQAKPSMMTPEGGGGGGHDHGHGSGSSKSPQSANAPTAMSAEFHGQIAELDKAYKSISEAIRKGDTESVAASFVEFGAALEAVDGEQLVGHSRMAWKEFAMLLGNDVVEGREVDQADEADRVYLLVKGHMRRMREQLGMSHAERPVRRIEVPAEFLAQLSGLWQAYLIIGKQLAGDNFAQAQQSLAGLGQALTSVDDGSLSELAATAWQKEAKNLTKVISDLQSAKDIKSLRSAYSLLSDEMSVLVTRFGIGDIGPVYLLHCPMAFNDRGAIWFQDNDSALNPYFGAEMLKCADRIELVEPREHDHATHEDRQKIDNRETREIRKK